MTNLTNWNTGDPAVPAGFETWGQAISEDVDGVVAGLKAINAQTGTTYTLVLADQSKLVTCSNAAAVTLTVPPNASVAFPVGTTIEVIGIGAGIVTLAQGSGVAINATPSLVFRAQHSGATLVKIATDTWQAVGDFA